MLESRPNQSHTTMEFPSELHYTKDHEWVRFDGDVATVGVTEFAQGELGDIVFVEVDTIGSHLEAGEVFGTIEAVKTVADLFLPIAGTVIEKNTSLDDAPEQVNNDAYNTGWIIKLQVDAAADRAELMTAEAYRDLVGQ
jgi:glycine cleavage system H protein